MLNLFLTTEIQTFFVIFVRLGAAVMFLPAFGESFVNSRTRLAIALLLTFILYPSLKPVLPELPSSPWMLTILYLGEAAIGVFMGLSAKAIMAALSFGGMAIATVSGLANALTNDPTSAQQASIIGSLLSMLGLLLVVMMDLHHLMLMAIYNSYGIFVPGDPLPAGDMATMMAKTVTASFALGFQMAAPFVAMSIIFYLGLGLISRLMPTMQVFFIALPVQIFLGMLLFMLLLPMMLHWFLGGFEQQLLPLAGF